MFTPEVTQGRNISAFRNPEFQCFFCMTGRGLLFTDPNVECALLSVGAGYEEVGMAMRALIARSTVLSAEKAQTVIQSGIVQMRREQWEETICAKYSYSTREDIYKKMLKCSINERDGLLIFSSSSHDQLKSWTGIKEAEDIVISASSSNREVGLTMAKAFERCE